MALSDFVDEVRNNIKRDINGVSDARIHRWVNWAQNYLADLHTYEEMKVRTTDSVTVASSNSLAWPTRMKDLYTATVQDGSSSAKMIYVPARSFDVIVPRAVANSEGKPVYYVDYGSSFELYPIPDAVYTINLRFSRYPEELALDADESDMLRKDALITAMATTFGFWSLREVEDAAYWGGELVPPLYDASLMSDHNAEDWVPIMRGFGGGGNSVPMIGDWWTNPFMGRAL